MTASEEILSIIAEAIKSLGGHLMLVGAYSRDYWIQNMKVYGTARTTIDVDLACRVATWAEFKRLVDFLKSENGLRLDTKVQNRLWLRDEIYADLIPFGGIEDANGDYAWPPDYDVTLNVQGFQAAYEDAVEVSIGKAVLKVIRPCWFALLKLKSFMDNPSRTKDLIDLFFVIDHYFEFIDEERRLYGSDATDADVFSHEPFDIRIAGATLLVRDCHEHGGMLLGSIQAEIRSFNTNDRLSIVFARVNCLEQKEAQYLLDTLLKPLA
jgi:predicted nucleotidyltransferase